MNEQWDFVVPPVFETNPSGASHAKAPNKSLLHDVEMNGKAEIGCFQRFVDFGPKGWLGF